jgi:hypothetical protein
MDRTDVRCSRSLLLEGSLVEKRPEERILAIECLAAITASGLLWQSIDVNWCGLRAPGGLNTVVSTKRERGAGAWAHGLWTRKERAFKAKPGSKKETEK